ncbi:SusC/RagA family TonB-linked outer membrane protein [uncultured Croceitalea sp.]|uniref:SusC/RagA family TonB-linked outer membrane protein n=1 Tax=uncultured Croceitalea sp. TaxID=1798908 RepID=UPI00374F843E
MKIKIESDMTLTVDEVFALITEQTDYSFIYHSDLFKTSPSIFIKKGIKRANVLLKESLYNGNFNIVVTKNNAIIIKKKRWVDSILQWKISGKVTDESSMPIPSVSVLIKGTGQGTTTDIDGNYALDVSFPENVLIFSSLGYETQEVLVGNNTIINVSLKEKVESLDEVVLVSDGYQKVSIEKVTGSYGLISSKQISRQINDNLISSLEGLTPGLIINNYSNGVSPSTGFNPPTFFVRGIGSFGNTQPLIVLDGFPIEIDRLELINNQDIESVTLLKDAAAASIWGVGGANGALVITTKKGKQEKISFSLRNTITFKQRPDLSYLNLANSQDAINIERGRFSQFSPTRANFDANATPYSPVYEALFDFDDGIITEAQLNSRLATLALIDNTKDLEKAFLNTPVTNITNLSFKGGIQDKLNYYGAFNLTNRDGNYNGDEDKIININLNSEYQVNDKTSFELITNYVIGDQQISPLRELEQGGRVPRILRTLPYQNLRDNNGNSAIINSNYSNTRLQNLINAGGKDLFYRPLDDLLGNYAFNTEENTIRINAKIRREIFNGFTGELSYLYQKSDILNENLYTDRSFFTNQLLSQYTEGVFENIALAGLGDQALPDGGIFKRTNNKSVSNVIRFQLNYNKSFYNGNHLVNAILGTERRKNEFMSSVNTLFGFNEGNSLFSPIDQQVQRFDNVLSGIPLPLGSTFFDFARREERLLSYYLNGSYLLNKKYGLNFSGRIDRSSQFSLSKQYLGSVGFKWNIKKELFNDSDKINNLQVRATWGVLGNTPLLGQSSLNTIGQPLNNFVTGLPSIRILNPANGKLTFEVTKTKNLGIDFGFFDQRINGSIDYYNKVSSDIISGNTADPTIGFFTIQENVADITNNGIELRLNTLNIDSRDFKWQTDINFSYNKNKVDNSTEDINRAFRRTPVNLANYPAYSMFAYRFAGLDASGNPQVFFTNSAGEQEATISPSDLTFEDLEHVGSIIPNITIGLGNNVTYKGFDLYFRFIYNGGHILNLEDRTPPLLVNVAGGSLPNFSNNLVNFWKEPGDENNTDVPAFGANNVQFRNQSSLGFADADYLKLRQVILSYSINPDYLRKTPFTNVRLHLQADNIWSWEKNKEGIDPEAYLPQSARRTLPLTSSYSLGATINF